MSTFNTLWIPKYNLYNISKFKVTTASSKVKSRLHHDVGYLNPLTIHFLHLWVSEALLGQDFKGQGHYGNVKGHIKVTPYVAHLHTPTNVPTKCQFPKPHCF